MAEERKASQVTLVRYLSEAYGKEKELAVALDAHIAMTPRASYKRRLQRHLRETKDHARQLERRIKQLGGTIEPIALPGPDALSRGASAAAGFASQALATAKGPLHALRASNEQERMLKNAKTEYFEEHQEIATYTAIEVLAETVGDAGTRKLARAIKRQEESMARFLHNLIPALTRDLARAEIPAAERRHGARRRSSRATRGHASGGASARPAGRGGGRTGAGAPARTRRSAEQAQRRSAATGTRAGARRARRG